MDHDIEKEGIYLLARPSKTLTIQEVLSGEKPVNEKIKIKSVNTPGNKKMLYRCSCCGNEWSSQKGHFSKTKSPLYYANNGYINICNDCRDAYYYQLIPFFNGDEEAAIDRMCSLFDWYVNEAGLSACRQSSDDRSRISHYLAKKNLGQAATGDTYLDTIKERLLEQSKTIDSVDDLEEVTAYKITPKMIKFWGAGYGESVYPILQGYYDELLKLCETKPDVKKQKMMKNLCLLEYQMQVKIQEGKDIGSLSNSYKAMFEAAELKIDNADTSNDSFGKWIMEIEKYAPAEYYQDKKKYHDFFGLVEYIERFMFRPLKNLIFGTKEKEKEYWINDDGGLGDGD